MQDIQTALARWRAAERCFDAAPPGSPERAKAEQECDEAQAAYKRLVERSTSGRHRHDVTTHRDTRGSQ